MAIDAIKLLSPETLSEVLLRSSPSPIDFFRTQKRPTKESIERDVSKLRSVSKAAARLIVDRRMAIASVGPYKDVFVIPLKESGYPALINAKPSRDDRFEFKLVTSDREKNPAREE